MFRSWLFPALVVMVLGFAALALGSLGLVVFEVSNPVLLEAGHQMKVPRSNASRTWGTAPETDTNEAMNQAKKEFTPIPDPCPEPDWNSTHIVVKGAAQLIYTGAYIEADELLTAHSANDPVVAGLKRKLAPQFKRRLRQEIGQFKAFLESLPEAQRQLFSRSGPLSQQDSMSTVLVADPSRISLQDCAKALPIDWLRCFEYNLFVGLLEDIQLSSEVIGWLVEAAPEYDVKLLEQLKTSKELTRQDYATVLTEHGK